MQILNNTIQPLADDLKKTIAPSVFDTMIENGNATTVPNELNSNFSNLQGTCLFSKT